MSTEMQSLQMKVQEHDHRLTTMDRTMMEAIEEQRLLVRELHALTGKFGIYIERHDQVSEANKRLWSAFERQANDITALQNTASANQPIIEGIKTLNSKLVWLVISVVLSPIAIAATIIYKLVP